VDFLLGVAKERKLRIDLKQNCVLDWLCHVELNNPDIRAGRAGWSEKMPNASDSLAVAMLRFSGQIVEL
jgi:hypothetical protein